MSCLSVEITLLPRLLSGEVTISRVPSPPIIQITRKDGIEIKVDRATKRLALSVFDIFADNHPKISCGIVCSVADINYLRVSPKDVQWISPSYGIVYTVETNTNWEIVTSKIE